MSHPTFQCWKRPDMCYRFENLTGLSIVCFKGPDTDINLHVFSLGTSEIDRMLRFRDWLRTNDTDRDKYAQVKRSLAKNKWRHVQHYENAKTSIVQEIMKRANSNNA